MGRCWVGLIGCSLLVGCFGTAPDVEDGSDASTGSQTSGVPTSGSPTTGAATNEDSTGASTDGSTGADGTSGDTTVGAEGDTGSTSDDPPAGTSSSSGGEPAWIAECALEGITVLPDNPTTSDEWTVRFEHPIPLTNVELTVADNGTMESAYGVDVMCGVEPFCWEFAPHLEDWGPGPISLSISAREISDATCEMELL